MKLTNFSFVLFIIIFCGCQTEAHHGRSLRKLKSHIYNKFGNGIHGFKNKLYKINNHVHWKKRKFLKKLISKFHRPADYLQRYMNKYHKNIGGTNSKATHQTQQSHSRPTKTNQKASGNTQNTYARTSSTSKGSKKIMSNRRSSKISDLKPPKKTKTSTINKAKAPKKTKIQSTTEKNKSLDNFGWRPFDPKTNEIPNEKPKKQKTTNIIVQRRSQNVSSKQDSREVIVTYPNKRGQSQEVVRNVKRHTDNKNASQSEGLQRKMIGTVLSSIGLDQFMALLRKANVESLIQAEGGFTIFAPNAEAFRKMPLEVSLKLKHDMKFLREFVLSHITLGSYVSQQLQNEMLLQTAMSSNHVRVNTVDLTTRKIITVNGARLIRKDLLFSNGFLHEINEVLFPWNNETVPEHIQNCHLLEGFRLAVDGTGLAPLLSKGPFTIFAPSTSAFASLDNSTVSEYLDNISILQDILLYHIVEGAHYSETLLDGQWLRTLNENEIQVKLSTDGYTRRLDGVGFDSRVLKADISVKNGVIHIIDKLMQPQLSCSYA